VPAFASGPTAILATLWSITPSAGSNTTVTPSGSPDESPSLAADFAYDFDRFKVMSTDFDSPGLTSTVVAESSTENSERGAIFSCADKAVLDAANKRESMMFFMCITFGLLRIREISACDAQKASNAVNGIGVVVSGTFAG
jgi:hypothetical protein